MPPTPTTPSLHTGDAEAGSLIDRVQDFASEHKKTILVAAAAAVVAAAGFAYIQYASASAEGKRKKKGSSKSKKKKSTNVLNGNEGPILEEKKPVVNGPPGDNFCVPRLTRLLTLHRYRL